MCEQIGGGEAETTLNACARDSEVSASRRSICLRFSSSSSSSKMKPRCPTRVMARGVSAASVRHARAHLRSQQRAAHANRSVYERGHRGLDEVVRLRVAKNVLRPPTGGDSPAERSRKVSISLDLSPLLRCAIDEAIHIDRSRRAARCVRLRSDPLAGIQPRRRPGTALYWLHGR